MAIKKLQNNYTTPEQSKRLLELGVPDWTADCVTSRYGGSTFFVQECQLLHRCINSNNYIPCWSVGRLIEMWEICVGVKFDRWSRNGVLLPLIEDCIEHIEFALNPYTKVEFDFSKLEE